MTAFDVHGSMPQRERPADLPPLRLGGESPDQGVLIDLTAPVLEPRARLFWRASAWSELGEDHVLVHSWYRIDSPQQGDLDESNIAKIFLADLGAEAALIDGILENGACAYARVQVVLPLRSREARLLEMKAKLWHFDRPYLRCVPFVVDADSPEGIRLMPQDLLISKPDAAQLPERFGMLVEYADKYSSTLISLHKVHERKRARAQNPSIPHAAVACFGSWGEVSWYPLSDMQMCGSPTRLADLFQATHARWQRASRRELTFYMGE